MISVEELYAKKAFYEDKVEKAKAEYERSKIYVEAIDELINDSLANESECVVESESINENVNIVEENI